MVSLWRNFKYVDGENDPEILDLADKDTDSKNDDNNEQQSEWDRDDNYDSEPEMDGSSELPDDADDAYLNFSFHGMRESSDDEEMAACGYKRWGKEIEEEVILISYSHVSLVLFVWFVFSSPSLPISVTFFFGAYKQWS